MFADRCKGASAGLLLALVGCSKQDITSYRVPKEAASIVASTPAAASALRLLSGQRQPVGTCKLPVA